MTKIHLVRTGGFIVLLLGLALLDSCRETAPDPQQQRILVRQSLETVTNGAWVYDFGDAVVIDGDGDACAIGVVFTILNAGDLDLEILGVELSSGDAADFDLDRGDLPDSVSSMQEAAFSLCFDPVSSFGTRAAEVSISTNDVDVPTFTFTVQGYGLRRFTAEDGGTGDGFGACVDLSGDMAIVGAGGTSAYIFYRNQGGADNWGQVKKLTGASESVAILDDVAFLGGGNWVYFFYRDVGGIDNWGADFFDSVTGGSYTGFGESIDAEGDTLVVGAPNAPDLFCEGFVRIFYREPGNIWGLWKELTSTNPDTQNYFGSDVSLSGDTLLVRQSGSNPSYLFFYDRDAGGTDNWGLVRALSLTELGDQATWVSSAALSGELAAVGVTEYTGSGYSGAVYVLSRNQGGANNWGLIKTIPSEVYSFGEAVDLCENTLAVSSYYTAADGYAYGEVLVFERNQGGADNWGLAKGIRLSDTASSGTLGRSLAIGGSTVLMGTPWYDTPGGPGSVYVWEP